jgi:hypothetical protein
MLFSLVLHVLAFLGGLAIVAGTVFSALRTFVLPRSASDPLTRLVFLTIRYLLAPLLSWARTYDERDRVMAFYAPLCLLTLVPTWYLLVALGYTGMYWSLGAGSWHAAFTLSGSSLLTLGFSPPDTLVLAILTFSEAVLGLILVALLIAYLPTMYAAFSRRETAVTLLEVRAGSPPSAVEILLRYQSIHGLDKLEEVWQTWEGWFADLEESHTSLAALVFFRSPRSNRSWVTAAGAVLDTAALTLSAVAIPVNPRATLCLRAGYLALGAITDFFGLPCHPDPHFPDQPISVTRLEFDQAYESLEKAGLPLQPDRERAWQNFAGWRVTYDQPLLKLASLTMAPPAPWSSDRAPLAILPPVRFLRR